MYLLMEEKQSMGSVFCLVVLWASLLVVKNLVKCFRRQHQASLLFPPQHTHTSAPPGGTTHMPQCQTVDKLEHPLMSSCDRSDFHVKVFMLPPLLHVYYACTIT